MYNWNNETNLPYMCRKLKMSPTLFMLLNKSDKPVLSSDESEYIFTFLPGTPVFCLLFWENEEGVCGWGWKVKQIENQYFFRELMKN